jgi:eukaryotic-like serine/threonine-protein kinase
MPTCDRERLGRYEVLAELGRGAMGTVYQARDPKIDRLVAIKTISVPNSAPAGLSDFRERFFREARAAGRLSHPGIVTIYDVDEDPECGPFIVMEYVSGRTLERLLSDEAEERLSPGTALDLADQLAEALHYAHTQGIVHRDIKPANIIVTEDGRAKITDFGIAKLDLSQFTATGQVFGTPSYMSPEQIEGEEVDARSDLFSLGVVLYSMLTGYRPFQGNSAATISFKLVYKEPVPVSALNAALPIHLDYVITRALAKSPTNRYQSGQEFALDLEDIQAGEVPRSQSGNRESKAADQTRVQSTSRTNVARNENTRRRSRLAIAYQRREWLRGKRAFFLALAVTLMLGAGFFYQTQHRSSSVSPATVSVGGPGEAPSSRTAPTAIPALEPALAAPSPGNPAATGAPVRIAVHVPFASATLSIWVDDKMTYERHLLGQAKKRMWVVKSVEGDFAGTMSVPAGKHALRVQVSSERDHYFGVARVAGEFAKGSHKTLSVLFHGHDHEMSAHLE